MEKRSNAHIDKTVRLYADCLYARMCLIFRDAGIELQEASTKTDFNAFCRFDNLCIGVRLMLAPSCEPEVRAFLETLKRPKWETSVRWTEATGWVVFLKGGAQDHLSKELADVACRSAVGVGFNHADRTARLMAKDFVKHRQSSARSPRVVKKT